jgi:16S rRNA (uracil1498-N3)-methyltransferase
MGHRFLFLLPHLSETGREGRLTGSEHHHLARVLRIAPGEEVFLTDGRGNLARARVRSVGREATTVEILERWEAPVPRPAVVLAVPLLRKAAFERLLGPAVEMGAWRILPFRCRRAAVDRYGDGTMERFRRLIREAAKQSFNPRPPELSETMGFEELLEEVRRRPFWLADPEGGTFAMDSGLEEAGVLVGPEAGFSGEERDRLIRAGARPVSLGPNRLRSETAALALLALIRGTGGG